MIGYLIAGAIGFFILHLIIPQDSRIGLPSRIVYSFAIGLSASSILLFVLVLSPLKDIRLALVTAEALLLVITAAFTIVFRRVRIPVSTAFFRSIAQDKFSVMLAVLLAVGTALSLVCYVMYMQVSPHGGWDSITIWNFRARGLFRGREMLMQVFSPLLTFDHHADYPLFIPLTVLHGWIYAGRETLAAPMAVGFFFTYGTLIVLMESLYRHRDALAALIGGCALLGIQVFHHAGAVQYADMPLAFFYLAAVVSIYDHMTADDRSSLILAGIFTGAAAWTKNEGVSFFAAVCAAWVLHAFFRERRPNTASRFARETLTFIAGAAVFIAVIVLFKRMFPVTNDIVGSAGIGAIITRITDPSRYGMIFGYFTGFFFQTRLFTIVPIALIVLSIALGVRKRTVDEKPFALPVAIMVCAAYFFVYLITPNDLKWQVKFSLDRLILHFYPFAIFAVLFALRMPGEDTVSASPTRGI